MGVNRENAILFDWFSMTTKVNDLCEVIMLLGMLDCPFVDGRGSYGYKFKKYFEGVSIHYGRDDNTVWLDMSGKGCRAYETYSTNCDWSALFRLVRDNPENYHITRLDVAYDDFRGLLNQNKMIKSMQSKNLLTSFKDYGVEHQSFIKNDFTLFFGSNKSRTYFRCYNKAAERGVENEIKHWVRFEIQLRDESAHGFILAYLQNDCNVGRVFAGVVIKYVRFVRPCGDSHKYRWKTAKFWRDFIGDAEKISIASKKNLEYNEAKLQDYVIGQAGQAVKCACDLYGQEGFFDMLNGYLNEHKSTKNPKYDELVERLKGSVINAPL